MTVVDGVDEAVRGVGLEAVFQPVVTVPDGAVVGFEALARWPSVTGVSPPEVFARARDRGTADQLDRLCITSAITGALDGRVGRGALLCINCEPTTVGARRAADAVLARAHDELQVMFEITERHLLTHPRALLRKVEELREDGFAIALDDVGVNPDSLALLDVIEPDVVKLDLSLVQSQPDRDHARTVAAVLAHHERTGAVILAEGIETDEHLEQALTVGATLGQGYRFGRPGPLGVHGPIVGWSPPRRVPPRLGGGRGLPFSPFDVVREHARVANGRKATLTAFSQQIEDRAMSDADPPMLFTALQRAENFSGRTRRRYHDLAARSPLVAVFGEHLPSDVGAGVRGVAVDRDDPLHREWTVLSLGSHTAAGLIAREHTDNAVLEQDDEDRRFEFVLTFDRPLIIAAARALLDRIP